MDSGRRVKGLHRTLNDSGRSTTLQIDGDNKHQCSKEHIEFDDRVSGYSLIRPGELRIREPLKSYAQLTDCENNRFPIKRNPINRHPDAIHINLPGFLPYLRLPIHGQRA